MKFKAFIFALLITALSAPSVFADQYYADGALVGTFAKVKCGYGISCTDAGEKKLLVKSGAHYAADTAASDAYAIAPSPALTAYAAGVEIVFKAVTANTGACTVNVNGLGAKNLLTLNDTTPPDNYIEAGSIVRATYDGTSFQITSPDANPV